ncbi:type II toxin-antitoxin system RelE/ParE family toxin [Sphingomonas cannabina]|uniref:type II toxin-antitoxin system RelE/ParE family toxin n=1 Tax=Sphingomonas cannabina TaxID=2899123 RepID=UPI001F38CB11|nr:type II toxin-antitoxin system RelE/ParE family toxin [Sphingomonas cannabina]UIJ44692.1 type II toxin-antitoxin system RelE/ParE family toxin [Sphingomonas cannabina]
MRRVDWSDRAIDELDRIGLYIEQFDPDAAGRISNRIISAAQGLADFPHKGRRIGRGLRQLSVVYPYLIRYRVHRE